MAVSLLLVLLQHISKKDKLLFASRAKLVQIKKVLLDILEVINAIVSND